MPDSKTTRGPADTRVSVTRDGQFLILLIDRGRRTRRVFLRPDEAAMVVAVLQAALPEVVRRTVTAREAGTNPRAQGMNTRRRR